MKIQKEKFYKAAKRLSELGLTSDQKDSMLTHIYTATANPRPEAGMVKSPWSFSFLFAHRHMAVCAVLFLMFCGTTYASTQSLPGDLLYNFKIKVLEPVTLSTYWSEESKNEYRVTLLRERIMELQALKASGRIDTDSSFESYAATQKNVEDIEKASVFDEEGKNMDVATQINSYNDIADDNFKVETIINLQSEDSDTKATTSVEVEVELPGEAEVLEKTSKDSAQTVKELGDKIEGTVVETVEPITEEVVAPVVEEVTTPVNAATKPVTEGLGL